MSQVAVSHASAPSAPRARTARRNSLPLRLMMGYLLTIFALFLFWPINWPIYDTTSWLRLIGYVLICYAALGVMFTLGSIGPAAPARFPYGRRILLIGAASSIGLLVPLSLLYTGRGPWEVFAALADQTDTYLRGVQQAFARDTGGRVASVVSALAGPFIFAVIPLGMLHWRQLSLVLKGAVVATALSAIILSIMRGTDREIATTLIVAGSAFLVAVARGGASSRPAVLGWARRNWKSLLLLTVAVLVAASAFTSRKADRLGSIDRACVARNSICADLDAPLVGWLDDNSKFGISFFILSVSQGFYGLELGLEKDFKSTFGIGHSPALLSIYTSATGDPTLYNRAYTTRNYFEGWSDQNYWSSMMLWFANDVGFIGVVVLLAALGFLWGRAWRDAVYGRSDPAAMLFCIVMLMLFYLPANNQVFNTLDGYTTFFGWLLIWRFTKSRAAPRRRA